MRYFVVGTVILAVCLYFGLTRYRTNIKPDPSPKIIPGGIADLGPTLDTRPAFYDAEYKEVSSEKLQQGELTVTHMYTDTNSPCGTLLTQFKERGSVRLGRGPVYYNALDVCRDINKKLVPNDFSFRTYSCENTLVNGRIVGRATFAFLCGLANDTVECSKERIQEGQGYNVDWNCSEI